ELSSPGKNEEFISNQYIQDLYRFFKLHPKKSDFEDVFSWRFDFHNTTGLGNLLKEDIKLLRNIAEFYFLNNHYNDSFEVYTILLENEKSGELYQKIAFCLQKHGDYKEALVNYLKADLYELNKLWNLKKIALCYRNLKEPAKALEYYRQAELLDAENLGIQLSIGHCLLELDQFEDALKSYFKVEYLSPGNKKVWRPIAWCSFLTGKKEQAEKYFIKLVDDTPTNHDYMNMGHVQWSLGMRKEALDYYKKSIVEGGFSNNEFLAIFEDDLHHLINQGINSEDVPIMLDQLRYSLSE
ncbi:MAG: tetratricopeptide repeat protein, partial [Mariniphaga sp.]|nr:tetratricopeptide repeat protein [Mariniphaga sp.]